MADNTGHDAEAAASAEAAALVAALQGGDAAAALAAAEAVAQATSAQQRHLRAALLAAGVVPAMLQLLTPDAPCERLDAPLKALCGFLMYKEARSAAYSGGGVPLLLRILERPPQDAEVADWAAAALRSCLEAAFVHEGAAADPHGVFGRVFALLDTGNNSEIAFALVSVVHLLCEQRPLAGRMLDANCLRVFKELLLRLTAADSVVGAESCVVVLGILTHLSYHNTSARLRLYDAGVFTAVAQLLGAVSTTFRGHSEYEDAAQQASSFFSCAFVTEELRPRVHHLLRAQPGALAGATAVVSRGPAYWDLLDTLDGFDEQEIDPLPSDVWLLDSHFAACALLQPRKRGVDSDHNDILNAFVGRFCEEDSVRALAQPLPHKALPAAASLAMLAGDGAHLRSLLADGSHLDTLLTGLLAAAAPDFVQAPHACSARWQIRMLRVALKTAACAAAVVVAPPADAPAALPAEEADAPDAPPAANKRRRLSEQPGGSSTIGGGVTLTAADVNVPRRDSTVLLVAGRPFHACGLLLEKASGVLADALRDAPPTLDAVPVPLPVGVPEELHYALFSAAVEHAYTGAIGALEPARLLPLWCVGDHLAMDGVRAWCVPRLVPAMVDDVALLEAAWSAGMARPCEALCDACATAWLRAAAAAAADDESLPRLLARLQAGAPRDVAPAAHVARVLRAALLRVDAAADA
jgi:hypothetical protein